MYNKVIAQPWASRPVIPTFLVLPLLLLLTRDGERVLLPAPTPCEGSGEKVKGHSCPGGIWQLCNTPRPADLALPSLDTDWKCVHTSLDMQKHLAHGGCPVRALPP